MKTGCWISESKWRTVDVLLFFVLFFEITVADMRGWSRGKGGAIDAREKTEKSSSNPYSGDAQWTRKKVEEYFVQTKG